ncbi:MAG: hypothetical protein L6405_08295 [Actinomycetia bacterium]|nr:hypothetical protein [Actinomycetes bacterium]
MPCKACYPVWRVCLLKCTKKCSTQTLCVFKFDSLDFIACLSSHIPNKNEQMLRYLGFYSNVCRGRRKKQGTAESEYVIEGEEYNKGCSKTWARLIKKIYEVDPLICPKCGGNMRIIAFIEDIYKNLLLDLPGIKHEYTP